MYRYIYRIYIYSYIYKAADIDGHVETFTFLPQSDNGFYFSGPNLSGFSPFFLPPYLTSPFYLTFLLSSTTCSGSLLSTPCQTNYVKSDQLCQL